MDKKLKEASTEVMNLLNLGGVAVYLSGSLALNMQGVETLRPPMDVDILAPKGSPSDIACLIPEAVITDKYSFLQEAKYFGYSLGDFEIINFIFRGVSFDYFTPARPYVMSGIKVITSEVTPLVSVESILTFKLSHALDSGTNKLKHRDDLIYILSNIKNNELRD